MFFHHERWIESCLRDLVYAVTFPTLVLPYNEYVPYAIQHWLKRAINSMPAYTKVRCVPRVEAYDMRRVACSNIHLPSNITMRSCKYAAEQMFICDGSI